MKTEIQKAAALLSSLPRPLAARILDRLPSRQVAAIRRVADGGEAPTREERTEAVREFLRRSAEDRPISERRHRRLDAPASPIPSFHFLTPLPAAEIIGLLAGELPQTQAAILAQLPAHLSAEVLALLPETGRMQILRRLSHLRPISNAALADIAEVISRILNRRPNVRRDTTVRSGDVLGQLLANSSGSVHRILTDAIEAIQNDHEPPSKASGPHVG